MQIHKIMFFTAVLFCTLCFQCINGQNKPTLFEEGLISNGGVFGFTLSPNSDEAFWVRSNGKRDTLIIMQSKKINGRWQQPKPATFSTNPAWKDIDPIFSPAGDLILFQSNRPVESMPNRKGFDIWAVTKTKNGWSSAYHLGNVINSDESESFASIAKNGNIYFTKNNEDGKGQSDLYVSRFFNKEYQKPENLGSPINTNHRESNPFISPDENSLVYFSSDPSGLGDVDLYISYKKKGKWSEPKNLGTPINSVIAEFCPFIHKKEKRLYFARQEKDGSRFIENIYYYPFDPKKL